MKWVSLQMISFGSLLFLNDQISTTSAARCSRCISIDKFNDTAGKQLQIWYRDTPSVSKNLLSDTRTCKQAAKEMQGQLNNRALSPWKYRIDRDVNRLPHEIAVAECLCEGCIINERENQGYNSVPVFAPLMVLRRARCTRDPDKYVFKRELIRISVACTCAVPNTSQ